MSHVDEGRMHAYLDGAWGQDDPERATLESHFTSCAQCRAQLEQERQVRERANELLGRMAPAGVRTGTFEQMLAARRTDAGVAASASRGGSGNAAGRPGRRFYIPLTLAATVMLALTATWYARVYLPRASRPEAVLALDRTQESADRKAAPPATAVPPASNARDETRAHETAPGVAANAPASANAITDAEIAGQRALEKEEGRTAAKQEGKMAAAPPPVQQQAAPPPKTVELRAQLQQQAQASSGGANRQLADQQAQQRRDGRALDATDLSGLGVKGDRVPVGRAIPDSIESHMLAVLAAAQWRSITHEEATRVLGRSPSSIQGLAIDSIQTASVADYGAAVRLVQHTGSGTAIELLQWPRSPAQSALAEGDFRGAGTAGGAGAQRPPAAPAEKDQAKLPVTTSVARLPDATIILRAPLPIALLDSLARTLSSAQRAR